MSGVLSTVLIVESDLEQTARVCDNLYRTCLCDRIIHFSTGQDAMDFLCGSRPDLPRWDAARFAIVMNASNQIDAYGILVQLKSNPELSKIPVIVLAATVSDAPVFYIAGCGFYILKSTEYNALASCIDAIGAVLSMPQTQLPWITKRDVLANLPGKT
jgi:CheY-like chemotaxis protein